MKAKILATVPPNWTYGCINNDLCVNYGGVGFSSLLLVGYPVKIYTINTTTVNIWYLLTRSSDPSGTEQWLVPGIAGAAAD